MSKNKYKSVTLNGKKQRVHRHIMEEYLQRPLESFEHVYHINGDSQDNSLENLVVIKKMIRDQVLEQKDLRQLDLPL